jgi:mono/diheme cytochrome c family protein
VIRRVASVLLVAISAVSLAAGCRDERESARLESGGRAYLAQCAVCHGVSGEGDGPLAATIAAEGKTPPAALNGSRVAALGLSGVLAALESRAHRTADSPMPVWGPHLGQEWLDRVADFVLALPAAGQAGRRVVEGYLASPTGAPREGRRVYVLYCSGCHGAQGGGDGFVSPSVESRLQTAPLRGEVLATLDEAELSRVIGLGGAHAPKAATMPGWLYTISPDDRAALAGYLRHLPGTPDSD